MAGREDREWGQAVVAFVVPRSGSAPDLAALAAFAREELAAHEVPKRFELVGRACPGPRRGSCGAGCSPDPV